MAGRLPVSDAEIRDGTPPLVWIPLHRTTAEEMPGHSIGRLGKLVSVVAGPIEGKRKRPQARETEASGAASP